MTVEIKVIFKQKCESNNISITLELRSMNKKIRKGCNEDQINIFVSILTISL